MDIVCAARLFLLALRTFVHVLIAFVECLYSLKCTFNFAVTLILDFRLLIEWGLRWRLRLLIYSGNGDLTYEESKAHFTAWAFMKSPLLIVSSRAFQVYQIKG